MPEAAAVHTYVRPTEGFPSSSIMKIGAMLKSTMTAVLAAIALTDVFSDSTAVSIGTFTRL